jgi:uncharacterized lipoprotein YbaY
MPSSRMLTGRVRLGGALPAGPAVLRVIVEDVSRIDAAAPVVAQWVTPLLGPLAAGADIPFALSVNDVDEGVRYNVRVHIDTSGSGDVTPGDLVSTAAYPVLTGGAPATVTVEVRTI